MKFEQDGTIWMFNRYTGKRLCWGCWEQIAEVALTYSPRLYSEDNLDCLYCTVKFAEFFKPPAREKVLSWVAEEFGPIRLLEMET